MLPKESHENKTRQSAGLPTRELEGGLSTVLEAGLAYGTPTTPSSRLRGT